MRDALQLTARIWREDDTYVSWCPELDVASFGVDYVHALAMLREAVGGYLDELRR